ncbi:ABC transporter substrate-binding protein [Methanosarcina sp.]|uniref:ABC transporter substrate-binding protein n=1 Tax=Methanosarcina sp. TaxID=2213 RepID=UPI002ABD0A6C|nr:ABC transporter substrate-binding protein [Methanosarcina sp.]MDY9925887.1 ABC transporter substrate-binding protein [Methanosarcina sp.]
MKTKVVAGIITGLLLLMSLTLPATASSSANASDTAIVSDSTALSDSAAAPDITLSILGNANGDGTIDMKDMKYTESIILGSGNQTQFADATGDNSINMLDVTRIELINLGKAKELTLVDGVGRQVNVKLPVKNIIPTDYRTTETLLALGTGDMIVGVDRAFNERMAEFGLLDLPEVSMHGQSVDYEMVLTLEPDIVLLPLSRAENADDIARKLPNTAVVVMGLASQKSIDSDLTTMGFVLGKEKEANELLSWMQDYEELVKERTSDLTADEMPTFYYEYMSGGEENWWVITPEDPGAGQVAEGAGGRNIAAGLAGIAVEVDPEWVIEKNPDFMFADLMKGFDSGPGKTEGDMENLLAKVLSGRPGFEKINAVKNNNVYLVDRDIIGGPRWVIGRIYLARCMHPELFEDINPEEIHREYLKKFHNLEVSGTWAYPLPG